LGLDALSLPLILVEYLNQGVLLDFQALGLSNDKIRIEPERDTLQVITAEEGCVVIPEGCLIYHPFLFGPSVVFNYYN
jgi:hypothetical protein